MMLPSYLPSLVSHFIFHTSFNLFSVRSKDTSYFLFPVKTNTFNLRLGLENNGSKD